MDSITLTLSKKGPRRAGTLRGPLAVTDTKKPVMISMAHPFSVARI